MALWKRRDKISFNLEVENPNEVRARNQERFKESTVANARDTYSYNYDDMIIKEEESKYQMPISASLIWNVEIVVMQSKNSYNVV